MLTELRVRNFKSIGDSALSLSRVSVLIGENGSGKSSFIQALQLQKQTVASGALNLTGPIIDVGTFSEILHQPADEGFSEIEFGIAGITRYPRALAIGDVQSDSVGFAYSWAADASQVTRMKAVHELNDRGGHSVKVEGQWGRYGGQRIAPQYLISGQIQFSLGLATGLGQGIVIAGEAPPQGTEQATIQQARDSVNNLISAPATALRRSFFVPAIRGIERQSYDLGEVATDDLVSPGGSLVVSQALATTFAYRRHLEQEISDWMERVTNRRVRVRLSAGRKVSLDTITEGHAVNIANEGFGSNQLVHMLTQLALLPNDATLAIEEPEIHLHPAAQTQLVNVLVEATASRAGQLLMTTHSEHVLYALMALVAEGKLTRDDVAIHHVAIDQGLTGVRKLVVDSTGRIKGGLPGFFNVHVQEFRRFLDAVERKE